MKHTLHKYMLQVALTGLLAAALLVGWSASAAYAQRPSFADSPLTARVVGQPVSSIPAGTAQWFHFDYSFTPSQLPRPTVAVRLLDGVRNGLQFEIWSPERLRDVWPGDIPVGRGTPEIIAGCGVMLPDGNVVKCITNDDTWVGGFGAPGVYYIRIINTSDLPVAPQVIVSGPGLGQCVNPSPSTSPSAVETLTSGEGFVQVLCAFPPTTATAIVSQVLPASPTPAPSVPAVTAAPTSLPAVTATPLASVTVSPTARPSVAATTSPSGPVPTRAVTATVVSPATSVGTPAGPLLPPSTVIPSPSIAAPTRGVTATAASTVTPAGTSAGARAATGTATRAATFPVATATSAPTQAPAAPATATQSPTATLVRMATPPGTVAAPASPVTLVPTSSATPTQTVLPTATATLPPTAAPTRAPTESPVPTPAPTPSTSAAAGRNQLTLDITINSAGNLSIGGLDMKAFGVEPLSGQATQMVKQLDSAHMIVQGDVVTLDIHGAPLLKMEWDPSSRQAMTELAARYGYTLSSQVLSRAEEWISTSNFDITARYTDEPSKPLSANMAKPVWIDVGPEGQLTIEQAPLAINLDPAFMQTAKQSGFRNILLCWNKGALKIKADGKDLPLVILDKNGVTTLNQVLGLRIESGLDPLFNSKFGVDIALPGGAHQAGALCGD